MKGLCSALPYTNMLCLVCYAMVVVVAALLWHGDGGKETDRVPLPVRKKKRRRVRVGRRRMEEEGLSVGV